MSARCCTRGNYRRIHTILLQLNKIIYVQVVNFLVDYAAQTIHEAERVTIVTIGLASSNLCLPTAILVFASLRTAEFSQPRFQSGTRLQLTTSRWRQHGHRISPHPLYKILLRHSHILHHAVRSIIWWSPDDLTSNNVIDFSTVSASSSLNPVATEPCSTSPFTYSKPCALLLPSSPVQKSKRLLVDPSATLVLQCFGDKSTFREDDNNCSDNLFYSDIVVHQAALDRWAAALA
ncbi:hypothetical protein F4604DRAFT_1710397 [Suillus subluteus]|nr:hypothetical protein F4604DRAFT_1710397 [Suillus subluteus]